MIRAAIYARYSSDRQNALSVADQTRVCICHAEAQGWTIAGIFSDAAISGAAMANRPGIMAALDAADRGEFDLLLTEDEDRVARNLEHLAHVANRLRRAGAYLSTLSTGRVETMHVAFKGLMGEDFLRNLSAKTKRGVRANAERGLATGSRLFGYATQPGGQIEIVEVEADVIRQIFADYAAGQTARQIAGRLNLAGTPGPRGGQWNASSINGSPQRGNGILRTELYIGVKVWNRMDVVKDPFTGRRTPKMRPEAEWKRTPVPRLRIVDQETWDAVQGRKADDAHVQPAQRRQRRSSVFSGLLRCGACGGSYTLITGDRLGCSTHRERGASACANSRTVKRAKLEQRVLAGLQTRLLAPDIVSAYVRAYHLEWTRRQAASGARRFEIEKRIAEIERQEHRTIDAIERGTATRIMETRMMERDAERRQLVAELATFSEAEPPIALHPRLAEGLADRIGRLHGRLAEAALSEDPTEIRLIAEVRGLIDRIEIKPILAMPGSDYDVTLFGQLARFLKPDAEADFGPDLYGDQVVAGASYNQPPIRHPPPLAIAC